MHIPATAYTQIEITQMLVKLYLLLAQGLDRCVDQQSAHSFPEYELHAQLESARSEAWGMPAVNRVVQEKVERTCGRALALRAAFIKADDAGKAAAIEDIRAERAILANKWMTLSDLLAVFRSA